MRITRFLLLAFAAVVAGNATTLYVSQPGSGSIGEFDATTGAAINANLITGLSQPGGLALSGNNLFVTNNFPGMTTFSDTIGEYDATTGAAINANLITGLGLPKGLALSGNNLFVANVRFGLPPAFFAQVGEYDATTGAAIKALITPGFSGGGLGGLALSGNNLFVANVVASGTVCEYDATTGAAINANFITGLSGAVELGLSGNTLFVMSTGPFPPVAGAGTVGKYDATTGAAINSTFITGLNDPFDIALSQSAAPVPEPSTCSMIVVGGAALLGVMPRGKRRTA